MWILHAVFRPTGHEKLESFPYGRVAWCALLDWVAQLNPECWRIWLCWDKPQ